MSAPDAGGVPATLDGLLPHAGRSRLITRVVSVDAGGIVCEGSPLDAPDHPLRVDGRIERAALVEYAAQAMAIHGRLRSGEAGPAGVGYLIAVHDMRLGGPGPDAPAGVLRIEAREVLSMGGQVSYAFTATAADGRELASGRASVALREDGAAAGAPREGGPAADAPR